MITQPQIDAVLEQLVRGPAFVRELIYEMPPELRKRRPGPRVWSAHESFEPPSHLIKVRRSRPSRSQ